MLKITNEASSGVSVTTETALAYGPWFRGVQLISGKVAKGRMAVMRRQGKSKYIDEKHPANKLVAAKPNPNMTAFHFWKLMTAHVLTAGNGYAWIKRDAMFKPIALVPLDPQQTTPVLVDGELWYTNTQDGTVQWIRPYDILHFKGLSYDGLVGYSVIAKARESLGLGMGARQYATVFFKNGGRPSVVLTFPGNVQDNKKKEIIESWERMHGGLDGAHTTAALDMGADVKELSFSAADSQLIETRRFSIAEVANFLGAPPHKLGDSTRQGYASLEQENLSFDSDTISPIQAEMEQEVYDKLLTEDEKDSGQYVCEWALDFFRWLDTNTKSNLVRMATGGAAVMTVNEGRGVLGLNPDDDPAMDVIPKPLNMKQDPESDSREEDATDDTATEPDPQDDEQDSEKDKKKKADSESARAVAGEFIADTADRTLKRIERQAESAVKSPAKFLEWVDSVEAANGSTWRDDFRRAELAAEKTIGVIRPIAPTWLSEVAASLRAVAASASEKKLAGETQEAINQLRARIPVFAQECLR
ncbi:MAG: phage portal protein [Gemmataceae bacterium]